jgi:hypothetical protein
MMVRDRTPRSMDEGPGRLGGRHDAPSPDALEAMHAG